MPQRIARDSISSKGEKQEIDSIVQ